MPDIVSTPDDKPTGDRLEDFAPGDVLDGRYRVESVLGSGGMGSIIVRIFILSVVCCSKL